jgi:hypothetical protein
MRSKILPPLCLLIALPIAASYAQSGNESPAPRAEDYGIELHKSYPGDLVLSLMREAEAELDAVSKESYEAGYKAALLDVKPEAIYYQTLAEGLREILNAERKSHSKKLSNTRLTFGFAGFAAGIAGMGVLYLIL